MAGICSNDLSNLQSEYTEMVQKIFCHGIDAVKDRYASAQFRSYSSNHMDALSAEYELETIKKELQNFSERALQAFEAIGSLVHDLLLAEAAAGADTAEMVVDSPTTPLPPFVATAEFLAMESVSAQDVEAMKGFADRATAAKETCLAGLARLDELINDAESRAQGNAPLSEKIIQVERQREDAMITGESLASFDRELGKLRLSLEKEKALSRQARRDVESLSARKEVQKHALEQLEHIVQETTSRCLVFEACFLARQYNEDAASLGKKVERLSEIKRHLMANAWKGSPYRGVLLPRMVLPCLDTRWFKPDGSGELVRDESKKLYFCNVIEW